MVVYAVLAGLVVVTTLIKLFQGRLPPAVFKVGVVLYVLIPCFALVIAVWTGWGHWIGNRAFALFVVLSLLTGIGTGVGYHRLLTHRSFETYPAIRAVFVVLGAMGIPTRPVDFAANHLKHHAFPIAMEIRTAHLRGSFMPTWAGSSAHPGRSESGIAGTC
jgi:fatty-acid desaturase